MEELQILKKRYQDRQLNLRAHHTDLESSMILQEIAAVEEWMQEINGCRAELYSLYDDDHANAPTWQRAVKSLRNQILSARAKITRLGFERYLPNDKIDNE
jgi:hypothetical protein